MPLLKKDSEKKTNAAKEKKPRKSPMQYFRAVYFELKKTTWPTRDELKKYVIAILIFVAIFIAVVSLFDAGLGELFSLLYK